MSDKPAYEVTERGFIHWSPVPTTYGHEVSVYESSAAEQACMWLAHGTGIPAALWLNLERNYRADLKAGRKDSTS